MIEAANLASMIESQIKSTVDSHIAIYIKKTIEELILNPNWISRVEDTVNQEFGRKFAEHISMIDINDLVGKNLDAALDRWKSKLLQGFATTGIVDNSHELELTVMPGAVVVEHDLIANELDIQKDAEISGTARINNLCVTGSINVDNPSWDEIRDNIAIKTLEKIDAEWQLQLCQQVLALAREQGIDFEKITINGAPVIDGNNLNPTITETSIKKIGSLRDLTVDGNTDLAGTMSVRKGRVGINTETPEMALGIWDEEVSLVAGKFAKQKAYIGTSRLQNIGIGVNRNVYLEIDTEGTVSVNRLRVNQWRVDFQDQTPGYSGTRGDIVFNTDPKPGTPFAWQCVGGFRWQPLRSAQ
jgi:hypothetical protein